MSPVSPLSPAAPGPPPLIALLRCPRCARRYRLAAAQPGERLRCRCGAVLSVPVAAPHAAAVVRCSSCGGPRAGEARSCSYCGAEFTLRETDLGGLCGNCLARVSSRESYCHSCGTPLQPDEDAGGLDPRPCPACQSKSSLHSRRLAGTQVSVLECRGCAGLWLGRDAFEQLTTQARAGSLQPWGEPAPATRQGTSRERHEGPLYRSCPQCSRLMHRQNFGRTSGVIIDVCGQHGVWFDAHELDQLLAWVRRGGLEAAAKREAEERAAAERAQRVERHAREAEPTLLGEFPASRETPFDSPLGDFFVDLVDLARGWLRGRLG